MKRDVRQKLQKFRLNFENWKKYPVVFSYHQDKKRRQEIASWHNEIYAK